MENLRRFLLIDMRDGVIPLFLGAVKSRMCYAAMVPDAFDHLKLRLTERVTVGQI